MDFVQAAVDYIGSIRIQDDLADSYSSRGSSRERRKERERKRERERAHERARQRERDRERERERERERDRRRRHDHEHGHRRERGRPSGGDVEQLQDVDRQQELFDEHRKENAELLQRLDEIERRLEVTRGEVDYYKKRRKETEADRKRLLERNQELERQLGGSRASHERRILDTGSSHTKEAYYVNGAVTPMHGLDRLSDMLSPISLRPQSRATDSDIHRIRSSLDKTDEIDGAHVMELLADLNTEIARFAGAAVDAVVFLNPREKKRAWTTEPTAEVVERGFGERLCATVLESGHNHSRDPTLVQIAIQAWEAHCVCVSAFESLCPGMPSEIDDELQKTFERMRIEEPLSVATRWRALTRVYNKLIRSDAENDIVNEIAQRWTQYNVDGLSFIMQAAGCKDPAVPDAGTLRILFGPGIERIMHMGIELATILRENIISTDFDIVTEELGTPYEPTTMESVFGMKTPDPEAQSVSPEIVCTVELGLSCTTKAVADNSHDLLLQRRLLVKPKVVLPSVLQTLRREILSVNTK